MPAVQLNTRIDADAKAQGDAVLARYGYSASQAVRALWAYAAQHQDIPSFMKRSSQVDDAAESRRAAIMKGFGLAARLGKERGLALPSEPMAFETLESMAYDEMLEEYEANHV